MKLVKLLVLVGSAVAISACASAPANKTSQVASPASAPSKPAVAANITGVWMLTVETPMGARDMKLNAVQTGKTLTGTIANPRGDSAINGTVDGNAIAFSMKLNAQGQDVQIDYAGTVEGDSMTGKAEFGSFGNGTFTGKKQ